MSPNMAETTIPCTISPGDLGALSRHAAKKNPDPAVTGCRLVIEVPVKKTGFLDPNRDALVKCLGTCPDLPTKEKDVCDIVKDDVPSTDGKKWKRVHCACSDHAPKSCQLEVVLIYAGDGKPAFESAKCSEKGCGTHESCNMFWYDAQSEDEDVRIFYCECQKN
jgi:hypothetical protein